MQRPYGFFAIQTDTQRSRWFTDSPLAEDGFELWVPRRVRTAEGAVLGIPPSSAVGEVEWPPNNRRLARATNRSDERRRSIGPMSDEASKRLAVWRGTESSNALVRSLSAFLMPAHAFSAISWSSDDVSLGGDFGRYNNSVRDGSL